MSGAKRRTSAMASRAERLAASVVHAIPTATAPGSPATVSARAAAGVSAPSSTTSKPRQRSMLAAMARGTPWSSPGAAARMTVPRLTPRRENRGPRRLMIRVVTALARCSSAIDNSPRSHSLPMPWMVPPAQGEPVQGSCPMRGPLRGDSRLPPRRRRSDEPGGRTLEGSGPVGRFPRLCSERRTTSRSSESTRQAPATRVAGGRPVRTYRYTVMSCTPSSSATSGSVIDRFAISDPSLPGPD